ncbi:hypothetical protein CF326_g5103 [Tilletia indica]|nr:hypothetical protein CF326_g5103 [Tilletia indica]
MSGTPSSAPARNTRSSGPSMEEFRTLESTLRQLVTDRVDEVRTAQESSISDLRTEMRDNATSQGNRLGRMETMLERLTSSSATTLPPPVSSEAAEQPSAEQPSAPAETTTQQQSSTEPERTQSAESGTAKKHVYTVKTEDTGTFDGTPENLELFLSRLQALRFAETDLGWDKAVLRAIPLALRGRAALWHSTLTDKQRAGLYRIDVWFEALRENFSPHPAVVRRQARDRAWEIDREDILGYVFAKIALLKVAFRSLSEGEMVREVADQLPIEIQAVLRQPHKKQPSLVRLREELRVQEVFWRQQHNRPLLRLDSELEESTSRVSDKRTASFADLVTPSTLTMNTNSSLPDRQSSRGSVAQRRGKPYADDFDPSRLGRGKSPRTGKDTVFYRVPGTAETIWCERPCRRCGGDHFDFSHEHFASKPQRLTAFLSVRNDTKLVSFLDEPPPLPIPPRPPDGITGGIPVGAELRVGGGRERSASLLVKDDIGDQPYRSGELAHNETHRSPHCSPTESSGCKSREERAASPSGPTGDLLTGYSIPAGAMRGDGEGSGPPLDRLPHSPPSRGVSPPPRSSIALSDSDIDAHSHPVVAVADSPVLHIDARPQFHTVRTLPINDSQRPLARPTRRVGTVVRLPSTVEVGTGKGHRRHVPLTTHIHLNDATAPAISSLLDTGASLSSIDADLLRRLGGVPVGAPMRVHGLGDVMTQGWATITFFLPARDSHGFRLLLECTLDFHVLPNFAPGICLGLDFIHGQGVTIDASHGNACIRRYAFDVSEHLPAPLAKDAQLCSTTSVCLPARSLTWVPVDTAALSADVDYTFHPRLMTDVDETVQIAGPVAVANKATTSVLLGNFGTRSVHLDRRTPVADAVAAQLGDIGGEPAGNHELDLGSPLSTDAVATASADPAAWRMESYGTSEATEDDEPAAPLDVFEGADDPSASLARDAETVLVDDHFKVGVNETGDPHPQIVELLRRHHTAFALDGRPGLIRDEEMAITLEDGARLRSEPPRRASPEKRAAMDKAIDQLLDWQVIEPSSSPVSFPVLMVRQYDKWRFCVDYRNLNSVTVADRYPLPTTDAVFQTLQGKRWFSSLDAIRGYHQHPVRAEDRWKTAFVCHRGLYQYRTVPFGLRNAPAVFQRMMDKVLGELRWKSAVVYIDDVVAATSTMEEHVETLDVILSRATRMGLKFSPAKCTFAVPSLTLLGRKVSAAGVAVWQDRAKAVLELPAPTTLRDLYHVLGLFGYYRSFIPRYAERSEPLMRLTRGWRWESVGDRTRLVRKDGTSANADRELIEWTDEQERSFADLKKAIASPPVLAHPDPTRPYILYVDASKEAFAAVLQQVFEDRDGESWTASYPLQPLSVPSDRWSTWLRADRYFGPILRRIELDPTADEDWVLEQGLLVRRVDGRLALPEAAVPTILHSVHDDNGHFGYSKTFLAANKHYWRPRLSEMVRAWVRHCGTCQRTKLGRRVGELDVEADAQTPFDAVAFDLVLGLPKTRAGNDAVFTILDVFSRMILLEPCKSTVDAAGLAAIVSDKVLRRGWRPRRLISDSEARVTGRVMQALAASLKARVTPSPPHHQQANAVERAVQTVQHALRALVSDSKSTANWDKRVVPSVEVAMNSTPNMSTGYTPFDLVYLSPPEQVHAVFDGVAGGANETFEDTLLAASERLEDARRAINAARAQQKRRYDASRVALPDLKVGDEVFVRLRDRPIPGHGQGKLDARKAGPYRVAEVLSPHRVRLALPADLGIGSEFAVDQLDVRPPSPDPFAGIRNSPDPEAAIEDAAVGGRAALGVDVDDVGAGVEDDRPPLRPRARTAPSALRDFVLCAQPDSSAVPTDLLREPLGAAKVVQVDGRSVTLRERPIAYQSRLTSVSEKRLVAPELELCCLAWAFARLAHLLEGAEVTVVTDHLPMSAMLKSDAGARYGPTISRCRALLLPHLNNLRFVHRSGRTHKNVDALSRLIPPPS